MLNIENVTREQFDKGEELGYIVDAGTYENERDAELQGFYWYDEIDRWVNVEKFKEII